MKVPRLKIVVALHDYLPRHTGGSEIHAHQMAREFARRGHAVTALFTERDLSARDGEVRRGELDGVPTLEVVHQREYADVRESWEEARIPPGRPFLPLDTRASVPAIGFSDRERWGAGVYVIPQYCFGVDATGVELVLSAEHTTSA